MAGTHADDPGNVGILLDLDGVLWDTSAIHDQAFVDVGRRHGLEPVAYDLLAGRPTPAAWRLVLGANGREVDPALLVILTREKQKLARDRLRTNPPLSPDIGLLGGLSGHHVRLGLVTGASAQTTVIFLAAAKAHGAEFEVVVTGESVADGKPSPAPYAAAMAQLDLSPGDCWALEDSIQGLESAHSAQARTVHLTVEGGACAWDHVPTVACVSSIGAFLSVTGVTVPR
jgi:beta-phosphoglucomutase